MPVPATAAEFMDVLGRSDAVSGTTLSEYVRVNGPPLGSARAAARELIDAGLLTTFQAGLLLQGKHRGFTVAGRYRLLDHLAGGGAGVVYLCEQIAAGHKVAVKVLPAAKAGSPESRARLLAEAKAACRVFHPNVVRTYEADWSGPAFLVVREYVDGTSLQALVEARGPLLPARAAHALAHAALGLQAAAAAGQPHRDVRPGHLLMDRAGTVKLLDLGLGRFGEGDTDSSANRHDSGGGLGRADFHAPELLMDAGDDVRSDLYSLGVTAYFLLTGRTPYNGKTLTEKLLQHQIAKPVPPAQARPGVPAGLSDVVLRLLAKRPGDRFQTPCEVVSALGEWLSGPVPPPSDDEFPQRGPQAGLGSSAVLGPPVRAAR